jgi:hypothetical protein
VGSYSTVSPLPRHEWLGGLFSVALSVGLPRPGVTRHRCFLESGLSSRRLPAPRPSSHPRKCGLRGDPTARNPLLPAGAPSCPRCGAPSGDGAPGRVLMWLSFRPARRHRGHILRRLGPHPRERSTARASNRPPQVPRSARATARRCTAPRATERPHHSHKKKPNRPGTASPDRP